MFGRFLIRMQKSYKVCLDEETGQEIESIA